MDLQKEKYIILEIIPTHSNSEKGFIAQLSALKLEGTKLLDRFDYRVNDNLIDNQDIKQMISYDKKAFTYVDNIYFIIEKFKRWTEGLPLLLIEEDYTLGYIKELDNKKELVYNYFNLDYEHNVIRKLMDKYKLEPSYHIVDLIYEAIIYEGNNKK